MSKYFGHEVSCSQATGHAIQCFVTFKRLLYNILQAKRQYLYQVPGMFHVICPLYLHRSATSVSSDKASC